MPSPRLLRHHHACQRGLAVQAARKLSVETSTGGKPPLKPAQCKAIGDLQLIQLQINRHIATAAGPACATGLAVKGEIAQINTPAPDKNRRGRCAAPLQRDCSAQPAAQGYAGKIQPGSGRRPLWW